MLMHMRWSGAHHLAVKSAMRATFATALLLVAPAIVAADTVRVDGDGLAPVTDQPLALGSLCEGDSVDASVLLAVGATGHPGAGTNVFANGAVVTVAVTSTSGSGLTAVAPSASITLPLTWTLLPNGTISDTSEADISFAAGTIGSFAGTVTFTATGARSTGGTLARTATLNVSATVIDCTPPVLTLPADMTVEASGPSGAALTYTATADDAVAGSVAVSCTPPSGSVFGLGTTVVTCTASDGAGNTASGSFSVSVTDTMAPPSPAPDPPASPPALPVPAEPSPSVEPSTPVASALPNTALVPSGCSAIRIGWLMVLVALAAAGVVRWPRRKAT